MNIEVRTPTTPQEWQALARNTRDPNNHSPAVEANRRRIADLKSQLSESELRQVIEAEQSAIAADQAHGQPITESADVTPTDRSTASDVDRVFAKYDNPTRSWAGDTDLLGLKLDQFEANRTRVRK